MITIKDVCKKYGKKYAVQDISFTIPRGQITCLLGINGAGKSTLIKMIAGLIPLSYGEIYYDGLKGVKASDKVAYIPDFPHMFPFFTIDEACRYMKSFYPTWNESKADGMLKDFRLNKDTKISTLSKGNVAKLHLVFGLAQDKDYVLMDEPFSGIDLFSREEIINMLMSEYISEEQGVLLTTHEIHEVEHLADQVVLLHDGEMEIVFSPEEMRVTEGKSIIDCMREVYEREMDV